MTRPARPNAVALCGCGCIRHNSGTKRAHRRHRRHRRRRRLTHVQTVSADSGANCCPKKTNVHPERVVFCVFCVCAVHLCFRYLPTFILVARQHTETGAILHLIQHQPQRNTNQTIHAQPIANATTTHIEIPVPIQSNVETTPTTTTTTAAHKCNAPVESNCRP